MVLSYGHRRQLAVSYPTLLRADSLLTLPGERANALIVFVRPHMRIPWIYGELAGNAFKQVSCVQFAVSPDDEPAAQRVVKHSAARPFIVI